LCIREGDILIIIGENQHNSAIYLFNDSILIAIRKGPKLKLKHFLQFHNLTNVSRKEEIEIHIGYKEPDSITQETMILKFATTEIRESWLKQIISTMTLAKEHGSMRVTR